MDYGVRIREYGVRIMEYGVRIMDYGLWIKGVRIRDEGMRLLRKARNDREIVRDGMMEIHSALMKLRLDFDIFPKFRL